MIDQNSQVVRVEQGLLDRLAEEVARVRDKILVKRKRAGDQHGRRQASSAAGAPSLLPGAGYGTRVPRHHAGAQSPNIHSQFKRIGRDDAARRPFAQSLLDRAPLAGEVAAAISLHSLGITAGGSDRVAQVPQQHLGGQTSAGKDDGLHAGLQKAVGDIPPGQRSAAPDAKLRIH